MEHRFVDDPDEARFRKEAERVCTNPSVTQEVINTIETRISDQKQYCVEAVQTLSRCQNEVDRNYRNALISRLQKHRLLYANYQLRKSIVLEKLADLIEGRSRPSRITEESVETRQTSTSLREQESSNEIHPSPSTVRIREEFFDVHHVGKLTEKDGPGVVEDPEHPLSPADSLNIHYTRIEAKEEVKDEAIQADFSTKSAESDPKSLDTELETSEKYLYSYQEHMATSGNQVFDENMSSENEERRQELVEKHEIHLEQAEVQRSSQVLEAKTQLSGVISQEGEDQKHFYDEVTQEKDRKHEIHDLKHREITVMEPIYVYEPVRVEKLSTDSDLRQPSYFSEPIRGPKKTYMPDFEPEGTIKGTNSADNSTTTVQASSIQEESTHEASTHEGTHDDFVDKIISDTRRMASTYGTLPAVGSTETDHDSSHPTLQKTQEGSIQDDNTVVEEEGSIETTLKTYGQIVEETVIVDRRIVKKTQRKRDTVEKEITGFRHKGTIFHGKDGESSRREHTESFSSSCASEDVVSTCSEDTVKEVVVTKITSHEEPRLSMTETDEFRRGLIEESGFSEDHKAVMALEELECELEAPMDISEPREGLEGLEEPTTPTLEALESSRPKIILTQNIWHEEEPLGEYVDIVHAHEETEKSTLEVLAPSESHLEDYHYVHEPPGSPYMGEHEHVYGHDLAYEPEHIRHEEEHLDLYEHGPPEDLNGVKDHVNNLVEAATVSAITDVVSGHDHHHDHHHHRHHEHHDHDYDVTKIIRKGLKNVDESSDDDEEKVTYEEWEETVVVEHHHDQGHHHHEHHHHDQDHHDHHVHQEEHEHDHEHFYDEPKPASSSSSSSSSCSDEEDEQITYEEWEETVVLHPHEAGDFSLHEKDGHPEDYRSIPEVREPSDKPALTLKLTPDPSSGLPETLVKPKSQPTTPTTPIPDVVITPCGENIDYFEIDEIPEQFRAKDDDVQASETEEKSEEGFVFVEKEEESSSDSAEMVETYEITKEVVTETHVSTHEVYERVVGIGESHDIIERDHFETLETGKIEERPEILSEVQTVDAEKEALELQLALALERSALELEKQFIEAEKRVLRPTEDRQPAEERIIAPLEYSLPPQESSPVQEQPSENIIRFKSTDADAIHDSDARQKSDLEAEIIHGLESTRYHDSNLHRGNVNSKVKLWEEIMKNKEKELEMERDIENEVRRSARHHHKRSSWNRSQDFGSFDKENVPKMVPDVEKHSQKSSGHQEKHEIHDLEYTKCIEPVEFKPERSHVPEEITLESSKIHPKYEIPEEKGRIRYQEPREIHFEPENHYLKTQKYDFPQERTVGEGYKTIETRKTIYDEPIRHDQEEQQSIRELEALEEVRKIGSIREKVQLFEEIIEEKHQEAVVDDVHYHPRYEDLHHRRSSIDVEPIHEVRRWYEEREKGELDKFL